MSGFVRPPFMSFGTSLLPTVRPAIDRASLPAWLFGASFSAGPAGADSTQILRLVPSIRTCLVEPPPSACPTPQSPQRHSVSTPAPTVSAGGFQEGVQAVFVGKGSPGALTPLVDLAPHDPRRPQSGWAFRVQCLWVSGLFARGPLLSAQAFLQGSLSF
ncbi:hypothetical protein GWK47_043401 [Chionoecetes opilio]|uniref:Uncharacterized protein n=1 Tax=Chionoecetes opilio TaxID=41210 RepID=A0A8J5CW58_CHIOP|nr:hypothetical protein GWK47_043401 [Chionoecetes opilio]